MTATNGSKDSLEDHQHVVGVEDFRKLGYAMVDYIASYIDGLDSVHPVRAEVQPGYLRPRLPDSAPEQPESLDAILRDVDAHIMPGTTHWQHPAFFAYFGANGSAPSALADMLCNALGTIGFSWIGSPAATELETICMDWFAKLLCLPRCFLSTEGPGGGVIQSTASEAVLVAMLAARSRALNGRPPEDALQLVAYASDQAHSSVKKGCMVAGIRHLRLVPADAKHAYSMRPEALKQLIQEDLDAGLIPFFLCATIGTTSSCAVDPVAELAPVAQQHGMWLHVDSAWAGTFSLLPEVREEGHFQGLELVDSFCTNPHKGLLINFDCSTMWVKDATWIKEALSLTPEYLRAAGNTYDYKDWQVPLGRKNRALKLWFVMRMYGAEGLRHYVRHRLQLQERFLELIRGDERFEVVVPPRFGLICFRFRSASDEQSEQLLEAINATGRVFLTHTALGGRHVIRMAICGTHTQRRHVEAAWEVVRGAADAMFGASQEA